MKTAFFQYKTAHFPHISRFITAVLIGVFVFGVGISSLWLINKLNINYHVLARTPYMSSFSVSNSPQIEYQHWQQVVIQQPDYLDGYIMAQYYACLLGKKEEVIVYRQKALHIDPNNTLLHHMCEENK